MSKPSARLHLNASEEIEMKELCSQATVPCGQELETQHAKERLQDPLLYPGVPLKWKPCADLPVGMRDAQAVVLGHMVYVGGGIIPTLEPDYNIYGYDFTADATWKTIKSPTRQSALVSYQERLVLVGGVDPDTDKASNQLWEMQNEHAWNQPFPPMPTPRCGAAAARTQQYLIVAGGVSHGEAITVVEVYNGQQWVKIESLPKCCYYMKVILHSGFLFLMGGIYQDKSVFQCSVQSLIDDANSYPPKDKSLWKCIQDVPYKHCSVTTFGGVVVAVGGSDRGHKKSLHMYNPITQLWVHTGEMTVAVDSTCTITLPCGDMLVIGGRNDSIRHSHSVFKSSLVTD